MAVVTPTAQHLTSGNWIVKPGSEDEFIARWTDFLEWTRDNQKGLVSASLVRASNNPGHFISFADWDSLESLTAWRSTPEFASMFGACRALCDGFDGTNYTLAVTISGRINNGRK